MIRSLHTVTNGTNGFNHGVITHVLIVFLAVFIAGACLTGLAGCSDTNEPKQQQLQTMLDDNWADYGDTRPNWGGELVLNILTPGRHYFVTTAPGGGVTDATHFRAASTTKTFTAASIMLLLQRGLLNIDDRISDIIPGRTIPYVPDTAAYAIPYKHDITIKLLLQHRAGVFDVSNDPVPPSAAAPYAGKYYLDYVRTDLGDDDHTFTFDELAAVVADHALTYGPPDSEFHYSNTGYSILAKIIERVSGLSYEAFVRINFFILNGLMESSLPYEGADQTLPAPYAEGYVWSQDVLYQVTEDNMSGNVAEGNLITTPHDLTWWAYRLYRGEAGLAPEYVAMMMDYLPTGESHRFYGLGCNYTPGLGYGHNGGTQGYLTILRYDPAYDVTLLLFASAFNADDLYGQLDFMYEVAYDARRILGYPTE
jgi:D-alanyl-D-alanine carboxypeptidase